MSRGNFNHWIRRRELRDEIFRTLTAEDVRMAAVEFQKRLRGGDAEAFSQLCRMLPVVPNQSIEMMGAADEKGQIVFKLKIGERDIEDGDGSSVREADALPEAAGIRGFDEPVHDRGGEYQDGEDGRVSRVAG